MFRQLLIYTSRVTTYTEEAVQSSTQLTRQNHETNFGSTNVHVLEIARSTIAVCHCDLCHLAVHVVFSFNEFSTINLASSERPNKNLFHVKNAASSNRFKKPSNSTHIVSHVTICPSASCNTLIGTPIDMVELC